MATVGVVFAAKTQDAVAHQNLMCFFSKILKEHHIVSYRKVCYNDCN